MSYLLSIVVPTKDRYKYLKLLVNLIDSFNSDNIELVLQDNTANNTEILEFLSQKEFPHIKYNHTIEQIPVSFNSDLAVLNSTGEYVCMIGDDDGVLPNIIDCVKWMKENGIDALVPSDIKYIWPDFIKGKGGVNYTDVLILNKNGIYTNEAKVVDPLETLNELIKNGCLNRGRLPIVYHGIVARKTLNKIYENGGTFFPGASPDIANGVALCFFVEKYIRLDFPVIISGQSMMHGGGIRKHKDLLANIEDVPFLPKDAKKDWENTIPKVWTGETVWPESAIKALRYMGRDDLIKNVNYDRILFSFIFAHPQYYKLAIKCVVHPVRFCFWFTFLTLKKIVGAVKRRFRFYFFKEPYIEGVKIEGLDNIQNAAKYLSEKYSFNNPQ
jgi:glycosyltransferase involved in cell wall biosynthesis